MFVDHYEILQVSPNADAETIHRIYRLQARRFHPDNLETGDAEIFKKVSLAYEVLSDAKRREAYDREYRQVRKREAIGVAEPPQSPPLANEMQRREEILRLLYRRRFASPDQPSLGTAAERAAAGAGVQPVVSEGVRLSDAERQRSPHHHDQRSAVHGSAKRRRGEVD